MVYAVAIVKGALPAFKSFDHETTSKKYCRFAVLYYIHRV